MDDEQRKKLKDRLNVTRELVQKEFSFKEILEYRIVLMFED